MGEAPNASVSVRVSLLVLVALALGGALGPALAGVDGRLLATSGQVGTTLTVKWVAEPIVRHAVRRVARQDEKPRAVAAWVAQSARVRDDGYRSSGVGQVERPAVRVLIARLALPPPRDA